MVNQQKDPNTDLVSANCKSAYHDKSKRTSRSIFEARRNAEIQMKKKLEAIEND